MKRLAWSYGSKISEQILLDELTAAKGLLQGRLLDLGCGVMPYRSILSQGVTRWIGFDQKAASDGRVQVDVRGDVCSLPFEDGSFDSILCTEVLEHVLHPEALLREAWRVQRPGGILVLSTPQTHLLHDEPHDYFRFTVYALRGLAEEAGFEVVALKQMGGAVATVGQMIIWHLNWIGRIPLVGGVMSRAINATVAWTTLHLDGVSRWYGGGAMKDTLGWLLVARKRAEAKSHGGDGAILER